MPAPSHAFVRAAHRHGTAPETAEHHPGAADPALGAAALPGRGRRLLLTGEWIYQMRRCLGIGLARIRVHRHLADSGLPEAAGLWLRAIGEFLKPMEDIGTGHRLSLHAPPSPPAGSLRSTSRTPTLAG